MKFSEPMYFSGDSRNLQHLRDVTDQVMNTIQEMSGQIYVDIYSPKKSRSGDINVAGEED